MTTYTMTTTANDAYGDGSLTNKDSLDLTYRGFASLAAVEAASSDVPQNGEAGLMIDLGNGESVFLAGLSVADMTTMDIAI